MPNRLEKNAEWTLITIDDPELLSGKSIVDAVQFLLNIIEFKYIVLNEIYGNTEAIAFLEKRENIVLELKELLKDICKVKQFDWGDFFLFKEKPENWQNHDNIIDYPKLIAQSDTTIRAVDDQYIYVYTPYQEVIEIIKKNYEIESIKTDFLDKLDFPY